MISAYLRVASVCHWRGHDILHFMDHLVWGVHCCGACLNNRCLTLVLLLVLFIRRFPVLSMKRFDIPYIPCLENQETHSVQNRNTHTLWPTHWRKSLVLFSYWVWSFGWISSPPGCCSVLRVAWRACSLADWRHVWHYVLCSVYRPGSSAPSN